MAAGGKLFANLVAAFLRNIALFTDWIHSSPTGQMRNRQASFDNTVSEGAVRWLSAGHLHVLRCGSSHAANGDRHVGISAKGTAFLA